MAALFVCLQVALQLILRCPDEQDRAALGPFFTCLLKQFADVLVCLQVALQLILCSPDELERAAASHLMHSFCHANALGQTAVLSTLAASRE
jgi:hypothetical protein